MTPGMRARPAVGTEKCPVRANRPPTRSAVRSPMPTRSPCFEANVLASAFAYALAMLNADARSPMPVRSADADAPAMPT
jgi:hypothetical protein